MFYTEAKVAESTFEIASLPQTVLIDPSGRVILRVDGARDWSAPGFVNHWSTVASNAAMGQNE